MKKIFGKLFQNQKAFDNKFPRLDLFQKRINYKFKNLNLLKSALTHTSISNETSTFSFERMEFMGDAIVGFIASELLFTQFPNFSEGELSKLKSKIVSRKYMVIIARKLELGEFMLLSSEAVASGGKKLESTLANAMESLICAIYIDSDLSTVKKFITNILLKNYQKYISLEELINYKSILQEYTQSHYQSVPSYRIIKEEGPEHDKVFTLQVKINNKIMGIGTGKNKKSAQQDAAKKACKKLEIPITAE